MHILPAAAHHVAPGIVGKTDVVMSGREPFEIGMPVEVDGRFVSHWEVPGFRYRTKRRWRFDRVTFCHFVDADGRWLQPPRTPELPDRRSSRSWQVRALVTPVAHGRFGHKGIFHWKLRVDEWLFVEEIPTK
jgi:hypothetical protein